jgi:glutaconate CoA-transferase subunit B
MTRSGSHDFSINELNAVFISRELKDGERVLVGANLPVPRAGVLLAHLHHGPNMVVMLARTRTNVYHQPVLGNFEISTDWRMARWAESYYIHYEAFDAFDKITDVFFIGALQIDPYGNSNLIGIGKNYRRLEFRGPGAVGSTIAATDVRRYYLYVASHDRRIFVEKCDFISALGWGKGGDHRRRLALPGGGPRYCITPLCIMDFEEETKRMRLRSLHPGVSIREVVERTGFQLIIPDRVPTTEPPTKEELQILRDRVDIEGILRR